MISEPLREQNELHYAIFAPICGNLQILNLVVDNISVPVKSFQDPIDAQIYSSCLVSRGNVIIKDTHVLNCSANLSTI